MKFQIDQDYHIHSHLSLCSNDKNQTVNDILAYAKKNGLKQICVTDHYWDEKIDCPSGWYQQQNTAHIRENLPLPKDDKVAFYFGCETEMDKFCNVAILRERFDEFDFVIVPTTHLHMMGLTLDKKDDSVEGRRNIYLTHFEKLLEKDFPFYKMGIAHLTDGLIAPNNPMEHIEVLDGITDKQFEELFKESAKKRLGIELNFRINKYSGKSLESILRPYIIAKEQRCKFYFGSDSHHPADFENITENFADIAEALKLEESDKFNPFIK